MMNVLEKKTSVSGVNKTREKVNGPNMFKWAEKEANAEKETGGKKLNRMQLLRTALDRVETKTQKR